MGAVGAGSVKPEDLCVDARRGEEVTDYLELEAKKQQVQLRSGGAEARVGGHVGIYVTEQSSCYSFVDH